VSARVSRGTLAAIAVGFLTVAAVALLTGVVGRGWWRGDGGSYRPKHAIVRTSITPTRSLFGQIVTARADVVVDPQLVDPASLELASDFKPFNVRSQARRTVPGLGRATVVRFAYELQCLSRRCMPRVRDRGATAFAVSASRLTGRTRSGDALKLGVRWPQFGVQSRLTEDDIAFSTPRIDSGFTAPRVSWAASPDLLGGVALAASALLLLGAGWLVAGALRRDTRPLRAPRALGRLSPIERALVLAEHAASQGEIPESRKALERLAVELRRVGVGTRAAEAERLAWSERGPAEDTVAELAAAVRSNGAR
jgi:hypothetical protein